MSDDANTRPTPARLFPQLIKFGLVGGVGFVVNVVVFNALMVLAFTPAHVEHRSLYATAIANVVAIFVNWLGNRYWAFSAQRRENTAREGIEFFVVSLVGTLIPLGCVWISQYVLGNTSLLADNIANNGVGLLLGMIFRFALYRWWVFAPNRRVATPGPVVTRAENAPQARS